MMGRRFEDFIWENKMVLWPVVGCGNFVVDESVWVQIHCRKPKIRKQDSDA